MTSSTVSPRNRWLALAIGMVIAGTVFALARPRNGRAYVVPQDPPVPVTDAELDSNAIEVAARWLMEEQPDEREGRTMVFFLELPHGAEPSKALLDRLETESHWAEPSSASSWGGYGEPIDKKTGALGTTLTIGKSQLDPDGRMHVEVGRHCGGLCGNGGILVLERQGDSWRVLSYGMHWIS